MYSVKWSNLTFEKNQDIKEKTHLTYEKTISEAGLITIEITTRSWRLRIT